MTGVQGLDVLYDPLFQSSTIPLFRLSHWRKAMAEKVRKKEMFGEVEIETIYREARKPAPPKEKGADDGKPLDPMETMGHGFCPPFNQRTYLAEDGITCEQDVPVTLRDGTIIYT